jgi:hypothetical protein
VLEDAPVQTDLIDDALQAAIDRGGMTLKLSDANDLPAAGTDDSP